MRLALIILLHVSFVAIAGSAGLADAAAKAKVNVVAIEFNKLTALPGVCRLSFVIRNSLTTEIGKLALELVLFDKQRQVVKLLAINPGRLPAGKTRVKQFDIEAVDCSDIGRLLVNDVSECKGDGLTPRICLDALLPSSRLDVPFIN